MNNKYNNRKVTVNGIRFDSRKEANRYSDLVLLQRVGEIKNLQLQKKFVLIPSQKDEHGKVIERECAYIADFVYRDKGGNEVVEDVKGYRDSASSAYAMYVIKRKLMLLNYGIRIKEI